MEAIVHSCYYEAATEYYKVTQSAKDFFKNALMYLQYTSLSSISAVILKEVARGLGLAALLAEGIYNFGELLQHPIMHTLANTPHFWISQLLLAFNAGQITKANTIMLQNKDQFKKENETFLKEKLRIMTLMEMVYNRGGESRHLKFDEISKSCDVPRDHVELLVMKAFSLKVIKGIIDEVNSTVRFTWVQPRVLDMNQIATLKERIKQWGGTVHATANYLQENAPQLLDAK